MENIINSIEECLSILCQKHGMSDMFLLDWESNLMDHRNNRITTLKTLNSNNYVLQPVFQLMFIFGRGFQSPLFSPMLLTPPYSNFASLLFLLPSFFSWTCDHVRCVTLLNDIMDLNLLSVQYQHWHTVPAAFCCEFDATMHQIYWRFDADNIVFASTLDITHKQTQDTQGPRTNRLAHTYRHTYIYI